MSEYHWIYTTWPDGAAAEAAAETVIGERLAACANIIDGVTSLYEWDGKVQKETEAVMILKTAASSLSALQQRVTSLHPYSVPCFVTLPIDAGSSHPEYLSWLDDQTRRLL